MNKNSQYLITISCLVIAVSVMYYLFKYNPEQDKIALQNKLQIECQEIGSRKQKESDKISEEWLKQGYTYAGTFIFNKETNACLFRTISMHSGLFNGSIIDLFSNKTLADYLENKEGEIISGDKGEYLYLERMNF